MLNCLRVLMFFIVCNTAYAFGVDVCFNDSASGEPPIRNCLGVEQSCRTSNLTLTEELTCRVKALGDGATGLVGGNAIIGARSLLHSDSTYLLAQLIGFTPWQAYQIMIYSEATDQKEYTAFDQKGAEILTDAQMKQCREHWGPDMPRECLILTPELNGIYKFNYYTGGMFLHLHARLSPNDKSPPALAYPMNYFSPLVRPYENLLTNFRAWVFDERKDACAVGITQHMGATHGNSMPCEDSNKILRSPMNFFALGISKLALQFTTQLGTLILEERDQNSVLTHVLANDDSFQAYVAPHEVAYTKMGIFVHVIGDRHSHHMCTDRSYFYREPDGNYMSDYSALYCGQGSHFLWHVWEQGTNQADENLSIAHQTMRPALDEVYDQLLAYAKHLNIPVNQKISKEVVLNDLIAVLQIYDPTERLDSMVKLMEKNKLLPLPGHGSAAKYSVDEWLKRAGA